MMVFGFDHKLYYVFCFLSLKKLLAVTYGKVQIKEFLSDDDVKGFKEEKTQKPTNKPNNLNPKNLPEWLMLVTATLQSCGGILL